MSMKSIPKWAKMEKDIAKLTNGKLTKASGAVSNNGDVITDHFIIECKESSEKNIVTKWQADNMEIVEEKARRYSKSAALIMQNPDGKRYVLLTEQTYLFLHSVLSN